MLGFHWCWGLVGVSVGESFVNQIESNCVYMLQWIATSYLDLHNRSVIWVVSQQCWWNYDYTIIKGERFGCHIRPIPPPLMIILLLYVETHMFISETYAKLGIYYRMMLVLRLFVHLLVVDYIIRIILLLLSTHTSMLVWRCPSLRWSDGASSSGFLTRIYLSVRIVWFGTVVIVSILQRWKGHSGTTAKGIFNYK